MDNKPDRPPDGSGKVQAGVSFRDKVTGNKDPPLAREKIDFLKSKLVRFEWEEGDRLRPRCFVDETVMNSLAQPFHDALVVKLLGKHIGFKLMRDKLQAVWKPTGGFDVIDIGFDYFMVKFDREEDRNKALFDGPWLMFDHYLIVRPWSPDFVAEDSLVEKTLVWIWLPGLGVMYYDEAFLMAFASAVGRPIKIDFNTANVTRGKFARICVEIDLTLPVVGKIWLNNHWYKVEYEALHIICSSCGCYGHVSRNCHSKASSQTTTHIPTVPVDKDGDHVEVGGGGVSNVGGGEKPRGSTVVPNSVSGNSEPPGVNKGHDDANIDLVHGEWINVTKRKKKQVIPSLRGKSVSVPIRSGLNNSAPINTTHKTKALDSQPEPTLRHVGTSDGSPPIPSQRKRARKESPIRIKPKPNNDSSKDPPRVILKRDASRRPIKTSNPFSSWPGKNVGPSKQMVNHEAVGLGGGTYSRFRFGDKLEEHDDSGTTSFNGVFNCGVHDTEPPDPGKQATEPEFWCRIFVELSVLVGEDV
ncbi:uncharacterized protein LOC109812344 isoform X2 [Cajanus cajan]|uniref:uncharacterized protein LOC109812344 isoform X2 n=1 Tax=Cajanus cajan TaxID=3821 RepID=UPI0010FBAE99|nr:uncharacterized protein LOC109812344 isoform X2 [Cajanus cajan]